MGWFGALLRIIDRTLVSNPVYTRPRSCEKRSENQRNTRVGSQAKRATILDRHGSVFAINQDLISVYADPKVLRDKPDEIARKLAPLLNVSEDKLLLVLQQKNRRFVWLKRNLDYERLSDIRQVTKSIYGIGYRTHGKRSLPKRRTSNPILLDLPILKIEVLTGLNIDTIPTSVRVI